MKRTRWFHWAVAWLKNHKLISLVLLGSIIGGILYIRSKTRGEEIETVTVSRQELVQTLEVSGEIKAEEQVDLHFQTLGKLTWVGVKEGDEVKKWQGIATLDQRQLEKNLQKELNDYLTNRWNFEDTRDTYNVTTDNLDGYTLSDAARRVLERAQFSLNNAVLDVEIQSVANEYSRLVSPIAGIVTKVDTPVAGINITSTDLFEIVNPNTLYFSAEVDETDISLIEVGQNTSITLDAYENETLESTISWIDFASSTSEGGSTVFVIKLTLPSSDALKYRLGMNGDAEIVITKRDNALALPFEAIQEDEESQFVTRITSGQQEKVRVETGIETDDYVEIKSGIDEGDEIVIE